MAKTKPENKKDRKQVSGDEKSSILQEVPNGIELAKLKLEVDTLTIKLNDANKQAERLLRENNHLKSSLMQQRKDQNDIYNSLQKKIEDSERRIVELEEKLSISNKEYQTNDSRFEAKGLNYAETAVEKEKGTQREEELQKQINEYKATLYGLSEFSEKKDEMEKYVSTLEEQLAIEKQQHKDDVAELERTIVQEKERLKREMLVKIKETKTYLLSKTEDQLDTTTKRTIMENEHMLTELQYQSKETERVISYCAQLEKQVQLLKINNSLLKRENATFARKSGLVNKLSKKIKTLTVEKHKLSSNNHGGTSSKSVIQYYQQLSRMIESHPMEQIKSNDRMLKQALNLISQYNHSESELQNKKVNENTRPAQKTKRACTYSRTYSMCFKGEKVLDSKNRNKLRTQSVFSPVRPKQHRTRNRFV